ncbi:hypothetical protein WMZ97_15940 [Lentibacillus sp. N15]|uniref:hypothetical protein n=1 Tax=Lentibacillus songyuanensis TaxID=3136161 RepID=UPI0031BB9DC7
MKDIFEKINLAMENSGYFTLQSKADFQLLGEGAWHKAYLVHLPGNHPLVVRFPKKHAYGNPVPFNQQEMLAEYSGNGLYYRLANAVIPGICPKEYDYHVAPEFTYTIESYMGQPIDLAATDTSAGKEYGVQLGDFFRKMDNMKHNLEGFGPLTWYCGELKGEYKGDPQKFMIDEKDEFLSMLEHLQDSTLSFDYTAIQEKMLHCLDSRSLSSLSLTNQDTSPENLIIRDGRIHIIDSRPVLYSGFVFAGNHVNNYRTLFPTYDAAPRYQRHQFYKHKAVLHAMADGFEEGYTGGLFERKKALRNEQFLQLFSLCYHNYEVLQKEISRETYLRMGNKQAIESRLPIYLRELEAFNLLA